MQNVLVDFVWVRPKTADVYLSQIAFLQGVEADMISVMVTVRVSETTEVAFTVASAEIRERQSVQRFLSTEIGGRASLRING